MRKKKASTLETQNKQLRETIALQESVIAQYRQALANANHANAVLTAKLNSPDQQRG